MTDNLSTWLAKSVIGLALWGYGVYLAHAHGVDSWALFGIALMLESHWALHVWRK